MKEAFATSLQKSACKRITEKMSEIYDLDLSDSELGRIEVETEPGSKKPSQKVVFSGPQNFDKRLLFIKDCVLFVGYVIGGCGKEFFQCACFSLSKTSGSVEATSTLEQSQFFSGEQSKLFHVIEAYHTDGGEGTAHEWVDYMYDCLMVFKQDVENSDLGTNDSVTKEVVSEYFGKSINDTFLRLCCRDEEYLVEQGYVNPTSSDTSRQEALPEAYDGDEFDEESFFDEEEPIMPDGVKLRIPPSQKETPSLLVDMHGRPLRS